MASEQHGIAFARTSSGERSTTAAGRAIVAAALGAVDPVGARAAAGDTNWRTGYLLHYRRLVEAGIDSRDDWVAIARAGLDEAYRNLVVAGAEGDLPLDSLATAAPARTLDTVTVTGARKPETELSLPYRGDRLSGEALRAQLAAWENTGIVEPSVTAAIGEVMEHPEWLALPGRTVAVLGAGAEMGPLTALLRWGATVAGVDLPRPDIWKRVREIAEQSAGTLLVPVTGESVGADLLAEVPEVADWLVGLPGRLAVGTYLYADGGTHARLSIAADLLGRRVLAERPDTTLAFLATPTDVFAVPGAAVDAANAAYAARSGLAKTAGRALRWTSRGRLLHRAYPPGSADPGICDSLVPIQGPNYALAKRLQRWRAATALADGVDVSFHVAPSTRTRSVVKNRALAAAYAGAHRFGVEVFEPGTSNTLMAALLVHDLMGGRPAFDHPWHDEAYAAVHGGLWRVAYEPRSALGLAAIMGYAGAGG
ncbi:MAG: hypothetical protein QM655_01755 [Nocardioidaceae bacterium]